MIKLGTPFKSNSKKVLMLGSGELGKEVVIELQRLGIETIACDSYENAPAMQVAHRNHVFSMLDGNSLRKVIEQENPDYIIPEVEAIATDTLLELEKEGYNVIPTAKATKLTMNREGIRRLAAEELKLKTSAYKFAETKEEFLAAIKEIGIPCVVKPIMSSSGRGQSTVKTETDIERAWDYSQSGGRTGNGKVIVEGFVSFDYEITLLTVRHAKGTSFCAPIGHVQIEGDYRWSWQPQDMSKKALEESERIAKAVTDALGGYGIFGVELFIKGNEVFFSEVSPRPHDTGMVTLISQDLSEFALHARAILGLPIPNIKQHGASASVALRVDGKSDLISYSGLEEALSESDTSLRLFGKPSINGHRRLGVVLARGANIDEAIEKAKNAAGKIKVEYCDEKGVTK
jgi:phosphoribosylglycinamide formyltransferase 2